MYQILPMNTLFVYMMFITCLISILSMIFFWDKFKLNEKKKLKLSKMNKMNIMSLFMSFDPKTSISLMKEMNWFAMTLILFFLYLSFWVKPSRNWLLKSKILKTIETTFEIAIKSKKDSTKLIFSSLFIFILGSNMMGLIPFLFTSTSHITLNLFISLPFWTGFFLFGWKTFTKHMLAHLVPSGTPTPLISFMVLIELISTSIRPLTLSIRLMANMVSGHLLLTLSGNGIGSLSFSPMKIFLILLYVQGLLMLLEIAVSMIQTYVFCMLLTIYSDDSDFSEPL